jgi:hypothetical protein
LNQNLADLEIRNESEFQGFGINKLREAITHVFPAPRTNLFADRLYVTWTKELPNVLGAYQRR